VLCSVNFLEYEIIWLLNTEYGDHFWVINGIASFLWTVTLALSDDIENRSVLIRSVLIRSVQISPDQISSEQSLLINPDQSWSVHFWSVHFWSVHFWSVHFWSVHFWSVHFWSVHFWSVHFWSVHFWSVHFWSVHFLSCPSTFTTISFLSPLVFLSPHNNDFRKLNCLIPLSRSRLQIIFAFTFHVEKTPFFDLRLAHCFPTFVHFHGAFMVMNWYVCSVFCLSW
jgi:hypothetical protein